jgi:hypothetical protein
MRCPLCHELAAAEVWHELTGVIRYWCVNPRCEQCRPVQTTEQRSEQWSEQTQDVRPSRLLHR